MICYLCTISVSELIMDAAGLADAEKKSQRVVPM